MNPLPLHSRILNMINAFLNLLTVHTPDIIDLIFTNKKLDDFIYITLIAKSNHVPCTVLATPLTKNLYALLVKTTQNKNLPDLSDLVLTNNKKHTIIANMTKPIYIHN